MEAWLMKESKHLRVLYVEGDEKVHKVTRGIFGSFFGEVTTVSDGEEGMVYYKKGFYDLIIIDLDMPKVCDVKLIKKIREFDPLQLMIIFSEYETRERLLHLLEYDIVGFIPKPIRFDRLITAIEKSLQRLFYRHQDRENVEKIERLNFELNALVSTFDTYVIASRTDPYGYITYASDAFCEITGYTKEELIGEPHSLVRHPDMPSSKFEELWETIQKGNVWEGEIKNRTKSGGFYWVYARIGPYYDSHKNLIGYNAVRENITDKKEIESLHQRLAFQAYQTKKILDNTTQIFLLVNQHLKIETECSASCISFFGRNIKGETLDSLLFENDVDTQCLVKDIFHNALQTSQKEEKALYLSLLPKEITHENRTATLEFVSFEEDVFMAVITDITDKKAMEERMKREKQIQKAVMAVVTHPRDFFRVKNEFEKFINRCEHYVDEKNSLEKNIAILLRYLHTYKGIFSQKEMLYLPKAIHTCESLLNKLLEKKVDFEILIQEIKKGKLKEALHKEMMLLLSIMGESFSDQENSVLVDKELFYDLENRIGGWQESFGEKNTKLLQKEIRMLYLPTVKKLLLRHVKGIIQTAQMIDKPIYLFTPQGDKELLVEDSYIEFFDTLVHLFRNALDHGIEGREERVLFQKEEIGTIECRFYAKDERLFIEISDDGRGVSLELIRKKALEKELYSEETYDLLSEKEQYELIFHPAFSTKDEVTELSGRGVGLSAFKHALDHLKGGIEIKTEEHKGTTFIIKVPYKEKEC